MRNSKGFSLLEIILTVMIVTIAFLALTKGFMGISGGLIRTQNKTIAVNIAHEKVETLKKLTYPRLYVTTTTTPDYDTVYYPPVTYTVKSTDFTRYVTVRKVRETPSGDIEIIDAADPDEGLKRIKVKVTWTENEKSKNVTIYNLRQNPDRTQLNCSITGIVRRGDFEPDAYKKLVGATVLIVENPNWEDSTAADGSFEIKTSAGDWTVKASINGYYELQKSTPVSEGETIDAGDFDLTPMTVKTIKGIVISTSGVAVEGCVITCSDETSSAGVSLSTGPGGTGDDSYNFTLASVSTGTWTVYATTSSPVFGDISGSTAGIKLTTDDQFPEICQIVLSTTTQLGSISGTVELSDSGDLETITVTGGGVEDACDEEGTFSLSPVAAGVVTVTANPGGNNPSYTTATATATVAVGQNTQIEDALYLEPAGTISGIVLSPGGAYPGMVIRAEDSNGNEWSIERGVALSKADGTYKIMQLPVSGNPYKISPILDEGDTSDPENIDNIDLEKYEGPDDEVKYCTFTITAAWGYIRGNVTDNGEPITTGVLILASTGTITASPPIMEVGATGIYGGITRTEGEYEIKVRTGYTYNVYAWYTKINASWDGTETAMLSVLGESLSGTPASASVDFEWP